MLSPAGLIAALNALPPEAVWAMMLAVAYAGPLALLRLGGASGLKVWIAVAVIAANLQVLKVVPFTLFPGPVAEGTVVFASTYLATDLLTEHYGEREARQGVWLGFSAHLAMTVLMLLALGYRPLSPEEAGEGLAWALPYHGHLAAIFSPAPAFFAAGVAAFLASQLLDIRLFGALRLATRGRHLWLRNNLSTIVSALVDNTIFSLLAFRLFAADPVPWDALIRSYILGAWLQRVLLALLDTPFMYAGGRVAPLLARG
ncbi:MAG: queuosine precursor transporter [Acetobacteraceae bacterium]|nr:queuosine precursor transporter [Acetobacteraceae bacterium]